MKPALHAHSEYNYLKNNYMCNNENSNPFKFTYNKSTKKIRFVNSIATNSRVINRQPGQHLLKCTYNVYLRSHDGYCSEVEDYEQVGYENETQKLICLYFHIPSDLFDESGMLDESLLDNDGNLVNSERTCKYFSKWSDESSCCGVCGYTDLYIPEYIEWVKIV